MWADNELYSIENKLLDNMLKMGKKLLALLNLTNDNINTVYSKMLLYHKDLEYTIFQYMCQCASHIISIDCSCDEHDGSSVMENYLVTISNYITF